jgi:hypothetical protein
MHSWLADPEVMRYLTWGAKTLDDRRYSIADDRDLRVAVERLDAVAAS